MKPVLETERLKLIPFDTSDLDLLYNTFTDSFVRKYLLDDEIISYDKANEFISVNEQQFNKENSGLWKIIVKEDNTYAGFAGLWFFYGEVQPQLLYGLLGDKTKKGYAIEASKAIIDHAFGKLGFHYLIAACDAPNTDSQKVCERLSMTMIEEKDINGKKIIFYRLDY